VTWVADASVAIKWVIPEVLSDRADRLRSGDDDVLAPDLLLIEVANALWKKTASKEISPREADAAFDLVRQGGIDLRPTGPLLPRAMEIARRLDHPVYDCAYLALAEREQAAFVTADQRLLRRLATRKLGVSVIDLRTISTV
jgi:predicted nucleic acid-binding protein